MSKSKFLVGTELAHTNFNGLNTLFVSGFAYTSTLLELCIAHSVKHVHLGYRGAFQKNKMYNQVITDLFDAGYKVTLEYPAEEYSNAVALIDAEIWNNRNFVPLMTVNIGNAHTLGQNASIQFTDSESITPGFWSSAFSAVLDSNNFESEVDLAVLVTPIDDKPNDEVKTASAEPTTVEPTVVDNSQLDVQTVATSTVLAPATDVVKPSRKPRGPNKAKKNDTGV